MDPRSLTAEHKTDRRAICSELLLRFEADGQTFPSQIVTVDETWVNHFEPEIKRLSMEWHPSQSSRKKKSKKSLPAGKAMINVFWDYDGVVLVDAMSRGETTPDAYISTLTELRKRFKRVRPHNNPT
jgi:hypothetical protein